MANKSTKEMTTNYSDVEVSRLSFTDLEDNTRSKGQKIAYPRYNHPTQGSDSPLFIQFPWTSITSGGIPRLGEFYSDDSQRSFVKLPLDPSIPEIKQFSELLQAIDEELGSESFREKMFGSKASKYVYQPIYRLPQEEDEDVKKDPSKKDYGPRLPYMKLKIDTTFPDGKVKTIVFNSVLGANGKRTRTKIEGLNSIDDIASHICFMSKIRPIARPVKLWAQPPSKKDPTYGLTLKMAKVEVEPPTKTNSNVKQYLESDAFLDSDDESETIETVKAVTTSKPAVNKASVKQVAQVESDESEDSEQDSGDESDEEVAKPVTKVSVKAPVKQVAQVESDEDESEEEEVKPVKKSATKTPVAKSTGKAKKASA
jgi:hypothetical protein